MDRGLRDWEYRDLENGHLGIGRLGHWGTRVLGY